MFAPPSKRRGKPRRKVSWTPRPAPARPSPPQPALPRGAARQPAMLPDSRARGPARFSSAPGSRSRARLERSRGLTCPRSRRASLPSQGPAHLAGLWDAPRSSRRSSSAVLAPPMPQLSSLAVSGAPVPTRPSPTEPQAALRTPRIVDQPAPASGVPAALTIWKRKVRAQRGKWTEISKSKTTPSGKCPPRSLIKTGLDAERECLKH
ncbi:uncharacterized protein LOC134810392 isoform X3 [Pan troglodytes]|uniref:uncharacterized protein LOC134810392 isoform X3 n=1 Tax=Pan troglodytes TaxID=9598 RepID=UPI00301368C7